VCAGFRDIVLGDGRAGVRVRQNEVRRMAAGANGSDDESTAKQAFAVNAIHVVTEDVTLWNLVGQLDRGTFAVAVSAQAGDFHSRGRRSGGRGAQHIVSAMAGLAAGSQSVSVCGGPSVEALNELRLLVWMAGTAIHWRQFLSVRKLFALQVTVTIGAFQGGVRGCPQCMGIERRRYARLAFAGATPAFVAAGTHLRPGWRRRLLGVH
jgi:hypothetical protein